LVVTDQDDLDQAASKVVSNVSPAALRDFENLVKLMGLDRAAVFRLVIMAGINSLFLALGARR